MPNILDYMKEIRLWIIMGIALIILAGASYGVYRVVKNQEAKKYASQLLAKDKLLGDRDKLLADQKKLLDDKDKKIAELVKKLTEKPKASIQYVYVHDKPQVGGGNTVVVNSGDSVEVARKAYCDVAARHGVVPLCVITSGDDPKHPDVRCQANICNPEDENKKVEITKKGDADIHNTVDNMTKPTVWAHLGILGYQPFDRAMLIGYAPFDWRGLVLGLNAFSDFKSLDNSGAGAFVGWRPEFDVLKNSTIKVNLLFGLGVDTHFDDFKRIGMEGVIGAVVTERVKK